jgi:hypothetical protein
MINIHKVSPTIDGMVFREGGFPLGYDEGEPVLSSADGVEMAAIDGKLTYLRNLHGYTEQMKPQNFQEDVSGSNIRYNQSVVPKLGTERSTTEPFVLACMVYGKVGADSLEELTAKVKSFEQNGDQSTVEFYDGEKAFVQCDEAQDVSIELNGKTFDGPVVMARVSADGAVWQVLLADGSEDASE